LLYKNTFGLWHGGHCVETWLNTWGKPR
jgi:hypothetical protein